MTFSTIISKKLKEKEITHRKFYSDLQLPNNERIKKEIESSVEWGII